MNNTEAKFILNAYRPNGRDAGDAAVAGALAQAKNDPVLAGWFAREQAHGAAVAAKLREIAPPAGLREAILAGARASRDGGTPARRAWWVQPRWLLTAAAALVVCAAAWWRLAPIGGENLEEFAVNFVERGFRLQKRSADVAVLKSWLSEQRGPLPEALPAKFAELRALGCRTIDYRGRDVSLVCFERDGREFHVFVARREDAPGPADAGTTFLERGRHVAAMWADATNRYVLVSDASLEAVKRLL